MASAKNKDIYEKEADVVNFLLKSKKYKDSKNTPLPAAPPPEGGGRAPPAPPPPPETNIQRREKTFERYLRTNRIQIQGVNRQDLVKDVAGSATTRLNLTAAERRTALQALALSNVPISQIYNPTYKKNIKTYMLQFDPPLTTTLPGLALRQHLRLPRSAPRPRSRFLPNPLLQTGCESNRRMRDFLESLDLRR